MDVNQIYKLVFAVTIGGSLVGVSIYLMKLISAVTDNVKDFRKTTKNLGVITDELIEEQKELSEVLKSAKRITSKVENLVDSVLNQIIEPLKTIFTMLTSIISALKVLTNKLERRN